MAYSVQLFLDDKTETLIRAVWDKLAEKGVSDNMVTKGGRPHVALMVFDECDPGEVTFRLRAFSRQQRPVEARFETLGTFCTADGVLFLIPVTSPRFFLLHSGVVKQLGGHISGLKDSCKPNRFVPHCTVAYGLDKETLSRTVSLFSNRALPIVGTFNRVGLVEIPGMQDRCVYPLEKA